MWTKGNSRYLSAVAGALLLLLALAARSDAQALYSYFDESGVRVYTNVPPKDPVQDLKVIGTPVPPPPEPVTSVPPTPYDSIIEKYASRYNVDPLLIHSMISTESQFKPKAVSNKGALGLMQLMPATASRLGVSNAFDPDENIRGGVAHMRSLLNTFNNDLELSLAAYNAGENLVQRVRKVPNIKETTAYVRSITRKYGKKDAAGQATESPRPPTTYRWTDAGGVLHLTNSPPVEHTEPVLPLLDSPQ